MNRFAWMLVALLSCMACAPIPQFGYAPVAGQGRILYEYCNRHVPSGITFTREEVRIDVTIGRNQGRDYVDIHFEVPSGKTVTLQGRSIRLARDTAGPSEESAFPNVSLESRAIVHSYSNDPAWAKFLLPVTSPLVGDTRLHAPNSRPVNRNFWMAAYVNTDSAHDIWIQIPPFAVNGALIDLGSLHFERRFNVLVAKFNC